MEMEKRINSQEQEEDVIDLMEIARLLLHKWKLLFIALLAGAVVGVTYKLIIRHESDGNYDDSWYKIKNEYIENKYKNILPIKIPCIFAGNTIGIKWKNSIKDKVFKEINNVRQWARINHLR